MDRALLLVCSGQVIALLWYRWIGRVFFFRPQWQHPAIFWNPIVRVILAFGPFVAMVVLVVCAFLFTRSPWLFVALSVGGWIAFSSRPQIHDDHAGESEPDAVDPFPRGLAHGPWITGGTPVRAYSSGPYRAVLVKEPEAIGPADYLFALVVYAENGTRPVLCVTAEKSMAAKLLLGLPPEARGEMATGFGNSTFLGVFDNDGHSILGPLGPPTDIGHFEEEALKQMKMRLRLATPIEVVAQKQNA